MLTLVLVLVALTFGGYAVRWYRGNDRPVWRSLGLGVSRWTAADVVVGLLVPFVVIALVFVAERAIGAIDVTTAAFEAAALGPMLGSVLGYALFEEVMFRVLFLSGVCVALRRVRSGRWIAVAISAVLFGAVHLTNENATLIGAVGTALGGVIYAVAFLATRGLWLPLFLHISWNASQALWGFPVSGTTSWPGWFVSTSTGPEIWNGGAYGPEGGLPGMVARVVIFLAVVAYVHRRWPAGSLATLTYAPDPVRTVVPSR